MKGSSHRRQVLLLGAVGVLVMVVIADRASVFSNTENDVETDTPSARSRYLDRAAIWQEQQAVAAQSASWSDAASRAEDVWSKTQQLVIEAPTIELAGARFRDRVVEELRLLGVESPRATLLSQAEPLPSDGTGSPLRVISLSLQFDVQSHRDLYSAIDRLENLPGAWTAIESVDVSGPGRIQVPNTVSATLRLLAIGLIQGEARAEAGP